MEEFDKLQTENQKAIEDEDIESSLEGNSSDNSSYCFTQVGLEDIKDEAFEGFRTLMKMAFETNNNFGDLMLSYKVLGSARENCPGEAEISGREDCFFVSSRVISRERELRNLEFKVGYEKKRQYGDDWYIK